MARKSHGKPLDKSPSISVDWSRLRSTNPSRLGFAQSARRRLSDKSDKLLVGIGPERPHCSCSQP